uniref:Secreted protein n=1 Tax=Panagrolaimus sp. PS1159 TaxID=55785 RepID=A0AC35FX97_9BILA
MHSFLFALILPLFDTSEIPFIIVKDGDGDDEQFVDAPAEVIPTEAVETFDGVDWGVGAVGDARLSCPRFSVASPLNAAAAGSFNANGGDGDCVLQLVPGAGVVDGV